MQRVERELDEADQKIGEKLHVLDLDGDGVVSSRATSCCVPVCLPAAAARHATCPTQPPPHGAPTWHRNIEDTCVGRPSLLSFFSENFFSFLPSSCGRGSRSGAAVRARQGRTMWVAGAVLPGKQPTKAGQSDHA